jgi:DNA-binding LytR/AlgR family response regulator
VYTNSATGGEKVKITINENEEFTEPEIIINCRKTDEQILRIVAGLQHADRKVTGTIGEQTFILNPSEILYIDVADRRTFIYTPQQVYETRLTLRELEEMLIEDNFFRAGKSLLINFEHIQSLAPEFSGRLIVTMSNAEKLTVSRQFTVTVRQKLGMEG